MKTFRYLCLALLGTLMLSACDKDDPDDITTEPEQEQQATGIDTPHDTVTDQPAASRSY